MLSPLAALYGAIRQLNQKRAKPETLSAPVICVGNLTAGGAGKTPLALYIGRYLKQKNCGAYFLTRGYGGNLLGPVEVNIHMHNAREVGDEALLLARELPTVVAKDKLAGARFAIERGAQVIVMDDGFQNNALTKTLSLLVIDGAYGFGNGRLLPAGPLRELPAAGFARADGVVVVNPSGRTLELPKTLPVIAAVTEPSAEAKSLKGKKLLAFCGIGYPQKFFDTLSALGAHVVDTVSFPDHYPYGANDIKKLAERARQKQAILVTTAKDAVRLTPDLKPLVTVVDISLTVAAPEKLRALVDKALERP